MTATTVWFARHEARLAWREWIAMMTAGRRARGYKVAIGFAAFVVFMHGVAYFVVGSVATAPVDKQALVGITSMLLLSWLLMISQATETMTRAFYARADLDLILSSPVAAQRLFAVRIATVGLSVSGMALPLAAPFIDILAWRGGAHWLGAYGVMAAMGASAAAIAVGITAGLFRAIGPKRTRLTAQVLAAGIGAAFVIGLQVAAILSFGSISRTGILQSDAVLRLAPGADSPLWTPARAVLGEPGALAVTLVVSFLLLAAAVIAVAPRFGAYAVAAAGAGTAVAVRARRAGTFRVFAPRAALRRKEWLLLRRDPWLLSQTLMQMLYLVPPAVLLWRSFAAGDSTFNLLVPVLVMAAGQLAGGLAWLTISGEDAPDLVATAPIPAPFVLRAKVEAVLAIIAAVFAPLLVVLAYGSWWHALVAACGIVIAAVSSTAIQLWFRTQAKRSQFRRRQVSSRVATFAEAFSSIGWAAAAAIAAVSLTLAIAPTLMALVILGGARYLAPRESATSSS